MPLNKEQKADIVKELSRIFGRVKLLIDGYEFVAETAMYKRTLVIQWFVNGSFKGAWLINECEERRRFCPKKVRMLYSKQKIADYRKIFGKKRAVEIMGVAQSITTYGYSWGSPTIMLRHLAANNDSIDLVLLGSAHR